MLHDTNYSFKFELNIIGKTANHWRSIVLHNWAVRGGKGMLWYVICNLFPNEVVRIKCLSLECFIISLVNCFEKLLSKLGCLYLKLWWILASTWFSSLCFRISYLMKACVTYHKSVTKLCTETWLHVVRTMCHYIHFILFMSHLYSRDTLDGRVLSSLIQKSVHHYVLHLCVSSLLFELMPSASTSHLLLP